MRTMMVVLMLTATLLAAPPSSATVWVVNVQNTTFSPKNLTIMQGDTIKWQWGNGSHTTTSGSPCSPDGLWSQPLDATHTTYQRQFSQVGIFPYFCIPHCEFGMTGTITVDQSADVSGDPSSDLLPRTASLEQNYPNPFNAATEVYFDLATDAKIHLAVYDILGRAVRILEDAFIPAGRHYASWNGSDESGQPVPTGIYFYRLTTDRAVVTRKMVLLR